MERFSFSNEFQKNSLADEKLNPRRNTEAERSIVYHTIDPKQLRFLKMKAALLNRNKPY